MLYALPEPTTPLTSCVPPLRIWAASLLLAAIGMLPVGAGAQTQDKVDHTSMLKEEKALRCYGKVTGEMKVANKVATCSFSYVNADDYASYQLTFPEEKKVLTATGLRFKAGGGEVGRLTAIITDVDGGVFYYPSAVLGERMERFDVDFKAPNRIENTEAKKPTAPYASVRLGFGPAKDVLNGTFKISELRFESPPEVRR